MKIRPEEKSQKDANMAGQMLDWTGQKYRNFNDYVAFREYDSLPVMAFKIILRFFGILIMLLLSPFLIIGLLIAFAAVI